MGNERTGQRVLHEADAIRRGQLLEFIVQQKRHSPSKGNITQPKTAPPHAKVRMVRVRPTSSKGLHKS
jgi:hypothetical protein